MDGHSLPELWPCCLKNSAKQAASALARAQMSAWKVTISVTWSSKGWAGRGCAGHEWHQTPRVQRTVVTYDKELSADGLLDDLGKNLIPGSTPGDSHLKPLLSCIWWR